MSGVWGGWEPLWPWELSAVGDMCFFDRCLLCWPYHACGRQLGGVFSFGSLVERAPAPLEQRWPHHG